MGVIIFQQLIWVDCVFCVSRGAGARKKRQGHGISYRESTKSQHIRKQLIFHVWRLPRCFTHVNLGVVELQACKTRQPTSQKPCLLLLETWQCERCNWQVAICNGQIEIMDPSSWWSSIGIHSYQSPMRNMQRLYRWGSWCSSPKSSQRLPPPNRTCTTPQPNLRESCISMVVGWVCTNRCRLCRGSASYVQFSQKE